MDAAEAAGINVEVVKKNVKQFWFFVILSVGFFSSPFE